MTSLAKNPICKIGVSILNADLSRLYDSCTQLLDSKADYLHLDVMDGYFVPNTTFGQQVVKSLRTNIKEAYFDMHMMVNNPEMWVEPIADAGGSQFTFHIEATSDPVSLIRKIREANMDVGIAMNPKTPFETIEEYGNEVDTLLVMTVQPGFGGQKFMSDMMPKVEACRNKFQKANVQVDGGVSPENIDLCAKAGANMIVSGNAIVKASSPKDVIEQMRSEVVKYGYK